MDPVAYFDLTTDDRQEWFVATDLARGPWNADHCHGGPPTGIVARSMERAIDDAGSGHQLVRLTVDLIRPVPMAGFAITTEIVRQGRSLTTLRSALVDDQGVERLTATGVALRTSADVGLTPTGPPSDPDLDFAVAAPGEFPIQRTLHGLSGFTDSVEVRYPPGHDHTPGPTTIWMRSVPLLAEETPSPFQRICPLADCGNATSRNAEPTEVGFVNPDLTIVLHRQPEGEWLGSQSESHWQAEGIGLADALLFDQRGPVGRALQTLLLTPQSLTTGDGA